MIKIESLGRRKPKAAQAARPFVLSTPQALTLMEDAYDLTRNANGRSQRQQRTQKGKP